MTTTNLRCLVGLHNWLEWNNTYKSCLRCFRTKRYIFNLEKWRWIS